jgi:hypothetical protein
MTLCVPRSRRVLVIASSLVLPLRTSLCVPEEGLGHPPTPLLTNALPLRGGSGDCLPRFAGAALLPCCRRVCVIASIVSGGATRLDLWMRKGWGNQPNITLEALPRTAPAIASQASGAGPFIWFRNVGSGCARPRWRSPEAICLRTAFLLRHIAASGSAPWEPISALSASSGHGWISFGFGDVPTRLKSTTSTAKLSVAARVLRSRSKPHLGDGLRT